MRMRRVAILIDGGFFIKRLKRLDKGYSGLPKGNPRRRASYVADSVYDLCRQHTQRLVRDDGADGEAWLDHVYRLFYYDAHPFAGILTHPVSGKRIEFGRTKAAIFRRELFDKLRGKRKFAVRLGHLGKVDGNSNWRINPKATKSLINAPRKIAEDDIMLDIRQKGVDMRIGLDMASMTLKRQVDTIILVTGDSDFIPAAKLARREGAEVILDSMGQKVSAELRENVDEVCENRPPPTAAAT